MVTETRKKKSGRELNVNDLKAREKHLSRDTDLGFKDFPGGSAGKTAHFQSRGRGSNPWSGDRSRMPHSVAKKIFFLVFSKVKRRSRTH